MATGALSMGLLEEAAIFAEESLALSLEHVDYPAILKSLELRRTIDSQALCHDISNASSTPQDLANEIQQLFAVIDHAMEQKQYEVVLKKCEKAIRIYGTSLPSLSFVLQEAIHSVHQKLNLFSLIIL